MEFEVLQEALVEVMNVAPNEIHMDTTLAGDLGMDSLDAFQIILKIQERLSIELDPRKIEKVETVRQAVKLLEQTVKANQ
ncbi:MAG: acyl carrier protein [Lachnospiraceae bacterium]|jgi:acyl carrier protein|nr:acyl carrier protein [Lachnospiraceae bacterium]OLA30277.1 MAG: acyl carrier protein [Firmicutes bacterium CAG_194_44_15]CCZ29078.1 acyl carrier protein [Firmicutes bacterium CAG:194]HCI16994.1 acyl carrier protein [Lachnospiraceae bacterium]HCX41609.1 acyl carrier protein [Lachnospiraceae bacterium]